MQECSESICNGAFFQNGESQKEMVNTKKMFLLETTVGNLSFVYLNIRHGCGQETFKTGRRKEDKYEKTFLLDRRPRENYNLLCISKVMYWGVQNTYTTARRKKWFSKCSS
jgi:hypothetical protein